MTKQKLEAEVERLRALIVEAYPYVSITAGTPEMQERLERVVMGDDYVNRNWPHRRLDDFSADRAHRVVGRTHYRDGWRAGPSHRAQREVRSSEECPGELAAKKGV